MSHAFKPAGGDWIEIGGDGSLLPGGGDSGEDVVMSAAFVDSLTPETRTARGFVEVSETPRPDHAIGWTIGDVDGVPVRIWQVEG